MSDSPQDSASLLDPAPEQILLTSALNKPRAMTSLVASATRITGSSLSGGSFRKSSSAGWQEDAWEMYDLVGEQRFLASTLASRMAQARFFVGQMPEDPLGDPVPVDDPELQRLINNIGSTMAGRAILVQRMGVNLFVAGDGWLVGIPKAMMPDAQAAQASTRRGFGDDLDDEIEDEPDEQTMEDLHWRMMSVTEVQFTSGSVKLLLGESENEHVEADPDDIFLIRVWRPHPRKWWESDSPTRSSLPVLRELVGLTMHISAQVDSRLAGAGVFIVPASAVRAMKIAAGLPEDSPDDPFTEALLKSMLTPIGDRSNASALVPLVIIAPDESAHLFQYMTFAKPLDTEARTLRDEAIRRLALGQDAPPELLLGTAGMNHWGAWLVREDVVTTHIEPPLALICDALTTQYLHPILLEMGRSEEEVRDLVIWYDVSHMVVRPNKGADAQALFDRKAISADALREANGFDESDAPGAEAPAEGKPGEPDLAALKAIDIVLAMPELMRDPGLEAVTQQVRNAMYGTTTPIPELASELEPEPTAGEPANSKGGPPLPPPPGGNVTPRVTGNPAPSRDGFSLTSDQIIAAFSVIPGGTEFIEGYMARVDAEAESAQEPVLR